MRRCGEREFHDTVDSFLKRFGVFDVGNVWWDHVLYANCSGIKWKDHCIYTTPGGYVLSTGSRAG